MTVIFHQNLCPQIVSGWWEGRICKLYCHFLDRIAVFLVFLCALCSRLSKIPLIFQIILMRSYHLCRRELMMKLRLTNYLVSWAQKKDNADDDEVKVDHISIFVNRRNLLCRNRWDTANKPSAAKTIRTLRLQRREEEERQFRRQTEVHMQRQ